MAKKSRIPKGWRERFTLIPGYDPVATARDGDWFDAERADAAVAFFADYLVHVEGEKAGRPLELEGWQAAIVGCLYGWRRRDGRRRYRETLVYVARKNGKSCLCSGLVILEAMCGGEPGFQIYSTGADVEQAALVFRVSKLMLESNPVLMDQVERIYKAFKSIEFRGGIYKALTSEAETKHGLNPQLVVNDELHAHDDRDLIDVMMTAMGARRQPLAVHITTADWMRESICNEKYEYACRVRDGVIEDPAFLPVIYEASPEDDWRDPETWRKANPNLGVSVSEEFLERECKRAQEIPAYENTFKRLYLNIRTEQDVRWLPIDRWDAASGLREDETPMDWRRRVLAELEGRECFGGLDLSAKVDLTAYVLIFKPSEDGEPWRYVPWFWIPEERTREPKLRDVYGPWVREGWIEATPGDEVDQSAIRRRVNELREKYPVRLIGYDEWNALEMGRQLREEDGFEMTIVRQGSKTLSDPMKEVEAQVLGHRMEHGANPVLRWCVSNVAVKVDENGNIQPSKKKSAGKIDGLVALVTGLAPALATGDDRVEVGIDFA